MCIRIKEGSINVTMLVAGTAVLFQSEDTKDCKGLALSEENLEKSSLLF